MFLEICAKENELYTSFIAKKPQTKGTHIETWLSLNRSTGIVNPYDGTFELSFVIFVYVCYVAITSKFNTATVVLVRTPSRATETFALNEKHKL